jgi:hypothetical protein
MKLRLLGRVAVLIGLVSGSSSVAQTEASDVIREENPSPAEWKITDADRMFAISTQAATMDPMTFRVGTVDQLQTVQAVGQGYYADVYADFAPTRWLQVGATMNYGNIGDPAVQNIAAPTVYGKVQFLRQETSGVNFAAAVNLKKIGFSAPTDNHPNDGEIEAWLLLDKRVGRASFTLNGVFGKSFSVPDSDAELKVSAGYFLLPNLMVGLDSIARYDTSFDGGPQGGTRYWEFTGGGIVTWKVERFLISGLGGVAAPMHAPIATGAGATVGPMGMVQLGYSL